MLEKFICLFVSVIGCALTPALAGVYQCIKPDGSVEFRDAPCENSKEDLSFLPIQYKATDKKQVQKTLKTLEKSAKNRESTQKKVRKREALDEKRRLLLEQKIKRRAQNCVLIKEKIEDTLEKLRTGGKAKRLSRLKQELLHQEKMKERYCGR